jgi:HTH-type transcriptional regulator, sugar sensing transcriptional regulator
MVAPADIKSLTGFGLTKNESIVYMTLAATGEAKVSRIIKESKFRSGKIYQVLDSLVSKGIATYVVKNNVKFYSPANPRKILDYIRLKRHRVEEEEEAFQRILPQLEKSFKSRKESCQVKVFEDVEGVRNALFTFITQLKEGSTVLLYGANDDTKRDAIISWPRYNEIARERGIKTRVVMTSISKKGRALRKDRSLKNYDKEYRFLEGTDVASFMACQDVVLLFNFGQPSCIFVENEDYARQFKELFSVLWKNGKAL